MVFVVLVATVLAAGTAGAEGNWSQQGADPGRSGYQAVDPGGAPVQFEYARTGEGIDRNVRTSIVTSTGKAADQRLVYGTDDGKIHVRVLRNGAPVGPSGGIDVSAAADPFGSGVGSVSPVESSGGPGGPGQVFAVHNERFADSSLGIAIAQVDLPSGELKANVGLVAGNGYRIQSSPLLTAPDANGNRSLFFVALEQSGPNQKLFKVAIANASSPAASIGTVTTTGDINANAIASPTLVKLNDAGGQPTDYVAVSTDSGLLTFAVANLGAGPGDGTIGEPLRTPSTPDGKTVYVAGGGPAATTVYRFTQNGNATQLVRTSSSPLVGEAAPALATDGSRVVVGTGRNLYLLNASDLAVAARYNPTDTLVPDTTGFRGTTAAITGALVAISTDGGRQLVLDRDTMQPLAADLFTAPKSAEGAQRAFGQPAISSRFLQIGTDRGIFVYGLRRATPPTGYWLGASDGGIFSFGDVEYFGSTGDIKLNKPIVGMAPTIDRDGYWLVASDGGVFAFGAARYFGSTGDRVLNSPIVGMVPTRSGDGYWLVAADGGVFAFGDAEFFGSTGDRVLNSPIVGMAATPTGLGYWLAAADGGIFTFGDAEFFGSTGDIQLNKPIIGMAVLANGSGYWLVASDGGVFTFGKARFFGSTGDLVLNSPIVAAAPSATGLGYLFTAADGGVFSFGDAGFFGSAASLGKLNKPIVTIAVKP
jgi:hypothetical protein